MGLLGDGLGEAVAAPLVLLHLLLLRGGEVHDLLLGQTDLHVLLLALVPVGVDLEGRDEVVQLRVLLLVGEAAGDELVDERADVLVAVYPDLRSSSHPQHAVKMGAPSNQPFKFSI